MGSILEVRLSDLRYGKPDHPYSNGKLVLILVIFYVFFKASKVLFPAVPSVLSNMFFALAFFASCIPVMKAIVRTEVNSEIRKGTLLIMLLVVALIFPLVMHHVFLVDQPDNLGRSPLATAASLSLFAVAWVMIGASLQKAELSRNNVIGSLALGVLLILILPNLGRDFVIDYRALNAQRGDGIEFNHLVLGETVTVLILFAFSVTHKALRSIAIALGMLAFFALGGRTALFAFVPTLLGFFAVKRQLSKYLPVMAILIGVPLALVLVTYADVIFHSSALSRMLIVEGLDEENSFVLRSEFIRIGLMALPDQILFGDPTFLVTRLGSVGTYMHNILSAWQFWGAFTFFYIIACCLIVLLGIWKRPFLANDAVGDFVLVTFLYGCVCVLTGKNVGFDLFWLGLGMGLARISHPGMGEMKSQSLA